MGRKKKLRNQKRRDREEACAECDPECEKLRKKIEDNLNRDKRADRNRVADHTKKQSLPGAGGTHGVGPRRDELMNPGSNKGILQPRARMNKDGSFKDFDMKSPRQGHVEALENTNKAGRKQVKKFMEECLDKYDKKQQKKLKKRMDHANKKFGLKAPTRAMRNKAIKRLFQRGIIRMHPMLRLVPPELLFPPTGPPGDLVA